MKKFHLGCLASLLLFSGCSIFERPATVSEPPAQPKELEPLQSDTLNPAQANTKKKEGRGSNLQTQLPAIQIEFHRPDRGPSEQSAEPSTGTLDSDLLDKDLLDKELLDPESQNKKLLNKHSVNDLANPTTKVNRFHWAEIASLCKQLNEKLFSLSLDQCLNLQFSANALSVLQRPLVHQDFINAAPANAPRKRVLIIGGIHGDEYSSTSVVFKWMAMIQENGHSIFDWRFLPSANPDGLLRNKPQRQNANNVDLNRNFLTQDWYEQATSKWRSKYNSDPRRFPGNGPASEPEVKWIVQQIKDFKPDAIISLHAPYGRVDFDGPPEGPTKLGALTAIRLGVFPGSLGNYTGVDLKIPTVTLELPSADKIPAKLEISSMWQDLQIWLCNHLEERCDAAAMPNGSGALDPVDVVNNQ